MDLEVLEVILGGKCCMTLNYRIGSCFFIEKLTNVKLVSFRQSVPVRIYYLEMFWCTQFLVFCVMLDRFHYKNKNKPLISVLLALRVPVSFFLSIQLCYCYCSIILSEYHFLLYILNDSVSNTNCYLIEYFFNCILFI